MLLARVWGLVLLADVLHEVVSVVMTLMDTGPLKAAAREMAENQGGGVELSDSMLDAVAYLGVGFSFLIALGVVGLLWWMLTLLRKGHKWAPVARRITMIFAFYFVVRAVAVFSLVPGSTAVPMAFYAIDGSLQILAGVGAVVTLVFVFRRETLVWTGEVKKAE